MKPLAELARRLRMLFRREQFDHDMDDEMRVHLELREKEYTQNGFSPEEAHMAARKNFGNALAIREVSHDSWGWAWLEHLGQDLRFAFRMFATNPGFTAVAVLTLALGIGANTAIFSVVYGVLLRPLPYHDPARLVVLHETTPRVGTVSVSFPDFLDWREQSRSFSELAAVGNVGFSLTGILQPESITGETVSSNFLSMMGIRPLLGRDFTGAEDKAGAAPVVLLNYTLWQSHFAGDANTLGRAITLDGRAFTVIGVLPQEFRSIDKTDVLEPIGVWATGNSS